MAQLALGEQVLDGERVRQEVERAEPDAGVADRLGDLVPLPELGLEVGLELVVDDQARAGERHEPLDDVARELLLRVPGDAVVAALHRREPRALAGHVVEDEVRERAQQHRVVGAQRLLDRLRMLGTLEDGEHVRAAGAAPERLRLVRLDEAEHEVRLPRVAVAEIEARLLELLAEQIAQSGRATRVFASPKNAYCMGLGSCRTAPTINGRAPRRAPAPSA